MPVTNLYFTNVGPFDEIEFEFDPQVNVFTGPNNSGKSSALWVLGDIVVYPFSFPEKLLRNGKTAEFRVRISGDAETLSFDGQLPCLVNIAGPDRTEEYWTSEHTLGQIHVLKMIGYSKFIPALRQSTDFRSPGPMATQRQSIDEEHLRIPGEIERFRQRIVARSGVPINRRIVEEQEEPEFRRRLSLVSNNPSLVSDEAVILKIVELDYRSYLRRKPEFRAIVDKIGEMASEITYGFPIKFDGVDEDDRGFFPKFSTVDGALPLNTMSQGTQSIIQWLAHLLIGYAEYYDFPENLEEKPGILIVDEIDAHLHPSWQRRVIPTLTRHFPRLQIFCSTHSPLMLAGLKEGQIQLLQRDENGKVTVSRNDVDIAGWSADEILRNFLGVSDPTDMETVGRLERLGELRRKKEEDLSAEEEEELERLRHTVSKDLLSGPAAVQIEQFAEELRRARSTD